MIRIAVKANLDKSHVASIQFFDENPLGVLWTRLKATLVNTILEHVLVSTMFMFTDDANTLSTSRNDNDRRKQNTWKSSLG